MVVASIPAHRTASGRVPIYNLLMCGRYRLSRRKQIVEEYFDTTSDEPDLDAPLQHCSHPARARHPPEPDGTSPGNVLNALGADTVMVEGYVWSGPDD
jgi:hypothetical protein